MKKLKSAGQTQTPASDRYEKNSRQPMRATRDEAKQRLEDETRSLTAEIDYTKKDATRHIVQTDKLLR